MRAFAGGVWIEKVMLCNGLPDLASSCYLGTWYVPIPCSKREHDVDVKVRLLKLLCWSTLVRRNKLQVSCHFSVPCSEQH